MATNTHLALDMMRESLYFSKYARKGVPKINILLTDGDATDRYKTLDQSQSKPGIRVPFYYRGNARYSLGGGEGGGVTKHWGQWG